MLRRLVRIEVDQFGHPPLEILLERAERLGMSLAQVRHPEIAMAGIVDEGLPRFIGINPGQRGVQFTRTDIRRAPIQHVPGWLGQIQGFGPAQAIGQPHLGLIPPRSLRTRDGVKPLRAEQAPHQAVECLAAVFLGYLTQRLAGEHLHFHLVELHADAIGTGAVVAQLLQRLQRHAVEQHEQCFVLSGSLQHGPDALGQFDPGRGRAVVRTVAQALDQPEQIPGFRALLQLLPERCQPLVFGDRASGPDTGTAGGITVGNRFVIAGEEIGIRIGGVGFDRQQGNVFRQIQRKRIGTVEMLRRMSAHQGLVRQRVAT